MILFLVGTFSSISQTNMTKIKDGTISGSSTTPELGVILELESVNKGFLTPRLSTQQRDDIVAANRADGMMIFNTTTGCFNYWSNAQGVWLSICGTPPPAILEISSLQCDSFVSYGTYKQGDFLTSSNYLTIPVTVTQAGTYEVLATTTNGYYFSARGTFPTNGEYTLILEGVGTPNVGYNAGDLGDQVTITLNSKVSNCTKHIFVDKASVDYSIDCNQTTVNGAYMIGRTLDNTNTLSLNVNVTSLGYWSIATPTINGYSFRGSGTFTTLGSQTITLLGSGAPIAAQTDSFNFTANAAGTGNNNCSGISVTVLPTSYTVDCSNAIISGTYKQDEPVSISNTVTIKVDVTATGSSSITTNTVAGVYFTSGPLTFNTLGVRDIVLTAVGTPNAAGNHTYALQSANGMVGTCSFVIPVTAQPVAYSLTCSSITVEGSYAPNIAMTADNKMMISVNVQYPGSYTISTDTVDGITFSANGTFASPGTYEVVLQATGTAITGGTHRFTITSNSTTGTTICNKNIDFVYRKMNVLGLGGGTYQPGTAAGSQTTRAVLQTTANFGVNGLVKVDGITIVNGGTNQGNTLKNLINTNKIDIIVIGYNYLPNAASIVILEDFVKNKKGVLIHSQENDATGTRNMINAIANSASTAVTGTGTTYINPILDIDNVLLTGPFGDIKGLATGSDVNNSYYVTGYSNEFTSLAHQGGNTSRSWMLMHNALGYVYIGDSGWTSGDASNTSTTTWPARMTSGGTPISKPYNGGITVYNSILYANTIAWAIKYAQENTIVDYQLQ